MSTIKADTVQPKDFATDLTLGASGDTVTVAANSININKVQDKGGNTLWDFSTGEFVSTQKEFASPNLKLLTTATISGGTSISFTSGIDSTYDVYIFKLIDINPSVDNTRINVNFSADGGSTFMTKTSTYFRAIHDENDTSTGVAYDTGDDLAQSTANQKLCHGIGSAASECGAGDLYLFGATSTTYIKNWYSTMNVYYPASGGFSIECFTAGYCNTTSAINHVRYEISTGVFDGTIKMYGLL